MSNRTPDKFSLFVPDEQEPERKMPDRLEIEDYMATSVVLPAGAYNPYEKPIPPGAAPKKPAQSQKPQDLRKLSEWIKARRKAEDIARENEALAAQPPKPRR